MPTLPTLLMSLLICGSGVAADADIHRVRVPNGSMTLGTDLPTSWELTWTGSGVIERSRDTEIFHTAPAALRIATQGEAKGNAACWIDVPAGRTIHLTGWIKTSGQVQVNVFAQPFSADWKPLGFVQLGYRHDNASYEWSEWTGTALMPEGTVRCQIGVLIEGTGSAWLDDVRDVQDPVFADEAAIAPAAARRFGDLLLDPPPAGDPAVTPLPTGKPWVPGWCRWDWRAAWVQRHQGYVAAMQRDPAAARIIFYGDSLTQGWGEAGKATWMERYAPLGAVNHGIGGDSTRQLLYRISEGELTGATPQLVVLNIGTNNLYDDANGGSDAEIARGVTTVVQLLRATVPQARILLLGILPRQNEWFCGRIARINSELAALHDGVHVHYLDMGEHFLAAPGTVRAELFTEDQLHLAALGYRVWADTMDPVLRTVLTP